MALEIEMMDSFKPRATIRVVGIGGGGNNALNNMIRDGMTGVEFIAANTDLQALDMNQAKTKVQLGASLTKGLGAGADPEVGRQAAIEDRDKIADLIGGSDMVFITAGLGGGTGTGGAPIVAEVSKEIGALTVAVVTKPFAFEGPRRMAQAMAGVEELKKVVDTLIVVPNERLFSLGGKNATLTDMFRKADDVLLYAVRGVSDLIMIPGLVNLDFADVRTVMSEMGVALMGTGVASGDNRAQESARMAISSPLLEDVSIEGARGLLMNITAASNITMEEVNEASSLIQASAHEEANIIWGIVLDDQLGDEMRVTVIATGIGDIMPAACRPEPLVAEAARGRAAVDVNQADHIDPPRYQRSMAAGRQQAARGGGRRVVPDLDVPTFLRRERQ